jgi:hypothetical protein
MKISGPLFFVLHNATSEKEFADLGQAPTFFPSYMQQRGFHLIGHPESNAFVLSCHGLGQILDPGSHTGKSLSS